MNNWSCNRRDNTSGNFSKTNTVQNVATGQKTELPTREKKRVKVGAGWNGQYGPRFVLDVKSLIAIAKLLEENDITDGNLKLRFYESKQKLSSNSPDYTLVAEHIKGISDGAGGYQELEIVTKQEEQVPF